MKVLFVALAISTQLFYIDTPRIAKGEQVDEVVIFYLSFGVGTYLPVTMGSIEEQAQCRFVLSAESNQARELRALFARLESGLFKDGVVRVKASGLISQPVFVDIEGGVLHGENEGRLAEPEFDALRLMLDTLAKQEGCNE